MVDSIAAGGSRHLPAMQQALEGLRRPRQKTEAETKLDEILASMKRNAKSGGAEAARQKLERIKAKLKMLQLAAGSAAASGDAKAARAVARQIKEAAKELSDALRGAGGGGMSAGGVGAAGIGAGGMGAAGLSAMPSEAQQAQSAAIKQMDADNPEHQAKLNGGTLGEGRKVDAEGRAVALLKIQQAEDALQNAPQKSDDKDKADAAKGQADLKAEARSLLAQMRKILEQARLALLHPQAKRKDAANAQDEFRDADQALAGLNAASLGSAEIGSVGIGNVGGIDLKA